jgi:hypothetical protein
MPTYLFDASALCKRYFVNETGANAALYADIAPGRMLVYSILDDHIFACESIIETLHQMSITKKRPGPIDARLLFNLRVSSLKPFFDCLDFVSRMPLGKPDDLARGLRRQVIEKRDELLGLHRAGKCPTQQARHRASRWESRPAQ